MSTSFITRHIIIKIKLFHNVAALKNLRYINFTEVLVFQNMRRN
uniref:Uncharacterized protein n=1 Tax=Anguilla anguilla TaxID=7936 RepID=A0A0E9QK46_ANGAN